MSGIILFDGECNLCNSSVQFILKRDKIGYFQFASLQGEVGHKLIEQYSLQNTMDSFILIENDTCYSKSTAALRVCKKLNGAWKIISILRIVPRQIRDLVYNFVANNRYKWFGKQESCMLSTPEIRNRFLD